MSGRIGLSLLAIGLLTLLVNFLADVHTRVTKGVCIDNGVIPGNFAIDKLATTGNIVYAVEYSEADNHVKVHRPKNGDFDTTRVDIVSCHQLAYGNDDYRLVELNYRLMLKRNSQ